MPRAISAVWALARGIVDGARVRHLALRQWKFRAPTPLSHCLTRGGQADLCATFVSYASPLLHGCTSAVLTWAIATSRMTRLAAIKFVND